jgi:Sec-independent protein secretion pathway component TatC
MMRDIGTRLSTLWVVVMFNMVFADILSFIKPGALQEMWTGQAGVHVTPGLLLAFAILLEIPIAMIFVSRILKPRASVWANGAAALITTVFVVGGGSLDLHYVFFATVEVACMALIVWSAWAWRRSEAAVRRPAAALPPRSATPHAALAMTSRAPQGRETHGSR